MLCPACNAFLYERVTQEWYVRDISKKAKTGIRTKGTSGKPIATEAPYGYVKNPDNKDFWLIDEEAAEVVRLIFRLILDGKNRNQIAVYLKNEQVPTPTFYMKDRGAGNGKKQDAERRKPLQVEQSHADPYPHAAGVLR